MPFDPQLLRAAMRHWATGVTIVTATQGSERAGATVSSFTSISLDPPVILVALNRDTYVHSLISQSQHFAVSLLAETQTALSDRFAGLDGYTGDRFDGIAVETLETGAPLLVGASAWLDCRVIQSVESGTHTVFFGNVQVAQVAAESPMPLIYFNRGYRQLDGGNTDFAGMARPSTFDRPRQ